MMRSTIKKNTEESRQQINSGTQPINTKETEQHHTPYGDFSCELYI
jgi:hypothetical protein